MSVKENGYLKSKQNELLLSRLCNDYVIIDFANLKILHNDYIIIILFKATDNESLIE